MTAIIAAVDMLRAGGLHRARKICAVAEAAGLPVVTEAALARLA